MDALDRREPLAPERAVEGVGFVAGVAAAKWSPPNSRAVPAIYIVVTIVALFVAQTPATDSLFRLIVWSVSSPLALIIGNELYRSRERVRLVASLPTGSSKDDI